MVTRSSLGRWRRRAVPAGCAAGAGLVLAALSVVAPPGPAFAAFAAPGPALAADDGPVPALTLGCLWAKAPQRTDPILTTAEAIADLHQTVKFGGTSGTVSNFNCTWEGKALPKVTSPEAPHYKIELWVNLYYSANKAAAEKLYNEIETGFGKPTPAHGIGNAAAYVPGQDIVTTQIIVISGANVFLVELNSTQAHSTQDHELATVAKQVVIRLAV